MPYAAPKEAFSELPMPLLSLATNCRPTYELERNRISTRHPHEYDLICYITLSPQNRPKSGKEAVADEISTVWRMISRRSMPTVWSERGDGRSALRESASPGGLAKVALGPLR
jgi:hypothetical protein